MITLVMMGERNRWFEASVGTEGEVVFRCKTSLDADAAYPYTVEGGGVVRFLTYDGARMEVEKLAINEFNRLHDEALAAEQFLALLRFIDEIAPPA